jgi:wyosine [tRNA(Phe)-imidazoG37] synthetase (radical SAM superfamily)
MSYFYGPVPSRRLGFSLGVDLIPKKVCSFDCIYCQLGKTTKKTIKRFTYIDFNKFKKELKGIVKNKPKIDYITISGSGEPTLHKHLDKIIFIIKEVTHYQYPVCVITNSSLLYRKDVREEIMQADLIIPSLDSIFFKNFKRINRPHKNITLKKIIQGLIELRKEYKGKIWLEIMVIDKINTTVREAKKFKEVIKKISPDKIQFNLPIRPTEEKVSLPDYKKLIQLKRIIGPRGEIVISFSKKKNKGFFKKSEKEILNFLKRRPATLKDLINALGMRQQEIIKNLNALLKKKKIRKYTHQRKIYFVNND